MVDFDDGEPGKARLRIRQVVRRPELSTDHEWVGREIKRRPFSKGTQVHVAGRISGYDARGAPEDDANVEAGDVEATEYGCGGSSTPTAAARI